MSLLPAKKARQKQYEKEEGVYLHLDFHGTILASVIFMTNASFDPVLDEWPSSAYLPTRFR